MAGPFSKLEDMLVAGPKDIRWEEAKDVPVAGPEDVRRDGAGIEIVFCVGLAAEKGGAIPSKARGDRSREARQSGSTVAEYGEVSAREDWSREARQPGSPGNVRLAGSEDAGSGYSGP